MPSPEPSPANPKPPLLWVEPTLGRLAKWLRLLGLDAPLVEQRPRVVPPGVWLLTPRRSQAGRPRVLVVAEDGLEAQLRRVLRGLGLTPDPERLFSRCLRCNALVEPAPPAQVAGLVPDHVWHTQPSFTRCPDCGRVYWPGSHRGRGLRRLADMLPQLHARLENEDPIATGEHHASAGLPRIRS